MALRAVIFDLDDTIVVDEAVSREALELTADDAVSRFGVGRDAFQRDARSIAKRLHAGSPVHAYCRRIGISAFECLWGRFEGETDDLRALREWAPVYRRQVFEAALRAQLAEPGGEIGEGGEELAAAFARHRRRLQRLMPDAREVVARLKRRYKLGLLTNGAPDLQREKIAACGLGPQFDAIAVSGELDIGKPDPVIFHHLLRGLGVPPPQAAMIGNSLERDIQGARNAGLLSIWLRVPGSEEPADVQPDLTILGLAELPALLEQIDNREAAGTASGG